jgi:Zn-dependent metalloprotease
MKFTQVALLCVFATMLALTTSSSFGLSVNDVEIDRSLRTAGGRLQFLTGRLGVVHDELEYVHSLHELLELKGNEEFRFARREVDSLGYQHVHFQQYIRGIEVDGGELAIHYDANDKQVFALSISVLADDRSAAFNQPPSISVHPEQLIRDTAPVREFHFIGKPELVYLLHEDEAFAAIRALVSYSGDHPVQLKSNLYASVHTGEHIVEFPLFYPALNRTVYNTNHTDELPGTMVRKEGQSATSDATVNAAYDNAGVCYNFYKTKFNRDSYDGKGAGMVSTVHYEVDFNNAFWNGEQMVYGDGDGVVFSDLASDLSVVCHELTHAVVQYTAGLRYFRESGALNEGFADIMGSSADIFNHTNCIFENQWQIGYECYAEGALRYMNNPTQDGVSYDYYPERFTGIADNGGVHLNSGIANLAYVLLAQGGVHPRQKTTFWVQGVGLAKAEQIFYGALTNYMLRTSDFLGTRFATELSADKLGYSKAEIQSVSKAWAAVGVGAPPKAPSPPAPSPPAPTPKRI